MWSVSRETVIGPSILILYCVGVIAGGAKPKKTFVLGSSFFKNGENNIPRVFYALRRWLFQYETVLMC
jgi:hypothetical protein